MMNNKINFNNKTILITGGAGFIGSHISEEIFYSFKKSNIIIYAPVMMKATLFEYCI